MRTLGIVSALGPEALGIFCRWLDNETNERLGYARTARVQICRLDRHELNSLLAGGDLDALGEHLAVAARGLILGGAEAILFDSSILHAASTEVEGLGVPFLHGIDACVEELVKAGKKCAGIVGTRGSAEEDAWTKRLDRAGIAHALPRRADRDKVRHILDSELARGIVEESSCVTLIRVMKALKRDTADAIVPVTPEFSLMIHRDDTDLPIMDAAQVHARAAVRWALAVAKEPA